MSHEDVFKDHYFFELERRDVLNGSLAFPVGLITLIGSALFLMFEKIAAPMAGAEIYLAAVLLVCAGCLLFATYYLIRAFWGYTYKYMPLSSALLDYRANLAKFFQATGHDGPLAEELAAERFGQDLDRVYAENCQINSVNNDRKSSNAFKANCFVVAAIACGLAAIPLYASLSYNQPDTPFRVEIANLKELVMSNERQPVQQQPPAQPPPAPAPAEMPVMPPSRDVREHVEPGKVR